MKLPRRIEYRDVVPRDANGKLLRRVLREEASL
jgi:acyl-CoA synthetase (AMP-forming)/AMP-acid ligase II